MLDAIAKLAPAFASIIGVLVALLVYRINADKLFLDMLSTRRDAVTEVLNAAQARFEEAQKVTIEEMTRAAFNLPAQSAFWRATDAAEGLFGNEVSKSMRELDHHLGLLTSASVALRDQDFDPIGSYNKRTEYSQALGEMYQARSAFAKAVKPYTHLGFRGLPFTQRLRLARLSAHRR